MTRIRLTFLIYTGNLWRCNRDYWGWIKLRTAWQAAGCFRR